MKTQSFWDGVKRAMGEILRYNIPIDLRFIYLGPIPKDVMDKEYLFKKYTFLKFCLLWLRKPLQETG